MIRRLLIPLLGSGLLLAATAGSAFAKCEGPNPPEFCKSVAVNLNIGGGEGTLQAGTREAVVIDVSLAEQPYDLTALTLVFARVADGSAVTVPAVASVRPGLWTADVLLPDGGSWSVTATIVTPDGIESTMPLDLIQVRNPALPPSTTPVTPPAVPPAPPILPIALGLVGIAAVALLGLGLRDRIRRRRPLAAPIGSAATADRA
jgi:hypothetical protein